MFNPNPNPPPAEYAPFVPFLHQEQSCGARCMVGRFCKKSLRTTRDRGGTAESSTEFVRSVQQRFVRITPIGNLYTLCRLRTATTPGRKESMCIRGRSIGLNGRRLGLEAYVR